jgi:hypothetical protein
MSAVIHILPLRSHRPGKPKTPDHVTPVLTSPDIAASRLALCHKCGQFNGAGCRLAGCCDKSLAQKVTWAFSQCPATPPQWLRISVTVNPK